MRVRSPRPGSPGDVEKSPRLRLCLALLLALLLGGCRSSGPPPGLTTREFADLIAALSERAGYFDTDNLISNETGYLHVVPKLQQLGVQGGAYLGVGPDQNFTYIAAVRPEIALILDIRRDNLLQHLMFKALFALAPTRAEFLSRLFSKPLDPKLKGASLDQLVDWFDRTPGQAVLFESNRKAVLEQVQTFGLNLSDEEDLPRIEALYRQFYERNLRLRFEFNTKVVDALTYPDYREFLLGRDPAGKLGNFLNRDEDYQFVRDLEARNLVVPLVGNFAGPKAFPALAAWLKERALHVSVFYTSNVEYYLLPDGDLDDTMEGFVDNVSLLPMADNAVLIRTYLNEKEGVAHTTARAHPRRRGKELFTTTIHSLPGFVKSYQEGAYKNYWDIVVDDLPP